MMCYITEKRTTQRRIAVCAVVFAVLTTAACNRRDSVEDGLAWRQLTATGSSQCQSCHPAFYQKWATSHHGLAMQPFSATLAKAALQPQKDAIAIGGLSYRVVLEGEAGFVEESGPKEVRKLPMQQAMGGKNTYYFLTPMERGRLQVLPLAYDIQKKSWYDMAASGVRMHAEGPADHPIPWTDPAFTFNFSLVLANFLMILAGSAGSPYAMATAQVPLSTGSMTAVPVSLQARRIRVISSL
jgi:hypothetical protein